MRFLSRDAAEFIAMLAVIGLLALFAGGIASGEDLGSHDTQTHLLAHAETGTLIMTGAHWLLKGKLKPWQVLVCGVTASLAANSIYEALNPKSMDQMAWRVGAGGLGALSVGLLVEF